MNRLAILVVGLLILSSAHPVEAKTRKRVRTVKVVAATSPPKTCEPNCTVTIVQTDPAKVAQVWQTTGQKLMNRSPPRESEFVAAVANLEQSQAQLQRARQLAFQPDVAAQAEVAIKAWFPVDVEVAAFAKFYEVYRNLSGGNTTTTTPFGSYK